MQEPKLQSGNPGGDRIASSRRLRATRDADDAAILDVARLAGSTLDVESMLERATQLVARLTGADRASIFLLDRSGERLLPAAIVGMGDEYSSRWKLRPLQVADEPLSREAIETGRVVVVDDARNDPRTDKGMVAFFGDRSIMVAPLVTTSRAGERTLGTLFANHVRALHRFSQRDVDLMESVAAQVAISLENARLTGVTRRLAAQLRRSFQVAGDTLAGATAEDADLRTTLQRLLDIAVEVIDADGGRIEVRDDLARGSHVVARSNRAHGDRAATDDGGDATSTADPSTNHDDPLPADVYGYETVPIPGLAERGPRNRIHAAGDSPKFRRRAPHRQHASDDDMAHVGATPVDRGPDGVISLPLGTIVTWRRDAPFGSSARALLASIASYAGVAIEQRRLAHGVSEERARREVAERTRAEFISMVTHELRTPLALIKGYVSTLRRADIDLPGSTIRRFQDGIGDAADRLARLVDNLLTTSALDSGQFIVRKGDVNLSSLVRKATSELAVLDPSRPIHVVDGGDGQAMTVLGDADLLAQVIQNLVGNAHKYSLRGEPVVIEITARRGWVRIAVTDTGPGIPPSALEHIFEKFFRVAIDNPVEMGLQGSAAVASTDGPAVAGVSDSPSPAGLGLGLYICRQVVTAHHGRIWAENVVRSSTQGLESLTGTRFIVDLPRAV
ncbi:MAG: ATP-binding protein [Chloroflexota bacterium]